VWPPLVLWTGMDALRRRGEQEERDAVAGDFGGDGAVGRREILLAGR
jgi:hypothetical protein